MSRQEALNHHRKRIGRVAMITARPTMRVGFDTPIDIELKRPLFSQNQRNLLTILGEFPNRFVNHNHLCERMGMETGALRIHITKLRKCLTPDWTIEARPHRGYRLIDLRDK